MEIIDRPLVSIAPTLRDAVAVTGEGDARTVGAARGDVAEFVRQVTVNGRSASERKGGPFGGLDAVEAQRRAVAARAAKREARERAADLDKLTLAGRTGVVLAKTMTAARLEAAVEHLLDLAAGKRDARGATAVAATRALTGLLRTAFALPPDDDLPDASGDLKTMTTAQRASARAELLRIAQERAADAVAVEGEHITT